MFNFGTNFAKRLKKSIIESSIIIELIGDVGAGKTTFVRGLATGLGITKPVTSPSFTISKSYALPNSKGRLIHYDFYRLSNPGLMSEDLAENITNPANIIVIEWGKSVSNLIPPDHTTIIIKKTDTNSRKVVIKNNRGNTFRDISQPTRSKLARSLITDCPKNRVKEQSATLSEVAPDRRHQSTGVTKHIEKSITRLYLDTSTPETILKINNQEYTHNFGHDLAEKLLLFIHDKLQTNGKDFNDITEITFMSGPGSFTGLRIGATIVNTLAHELDIPLYNHHGNKRPIIIPDYGRPANISKPRK